MQKALASTYSLACQSLFSVLTLHLQQFPVLVILLHEHAQVS